MTRTGGAADWLAGRRCGERLMLILRLAFSSLKVMAPVMLAVGILSGFRACVFSWENARNEAPPVLIALVAGWGSGTILLPLTWPWLPGRGAALKGVMAGGLGLLAWPAACGSLHLRPWDVGVAILLIPALASAWALRFAAVMSPAPDADRQAERRAAVPWLAGCFAAALALWLAARFH